MIKIKPLIEATLTALDVTHFPMRVSDGGYLEFNRAMTLPCCLVEEEVRINPTADGRGYEVPIMFYLIDTFDKDYDMIWDIQNVLFDKAVEITALLKKNTDGLIITPPKEYRYQHNLTNFADCGVSFEVTFRFGKC